MKKIPINYNKLTSLPVGWGQIIDNDIIGTFFDYPIYTDENNQNQSIKPFIVLCTINFSNIDKPRIISPSASDIELYELVNNLINKKRNIILLIRMKTSELIRSFTYSGNSKTYELTSSITSQFVDYKNMLIEADDAGETLTDYFPMGIEMGIEFDGTPFIQTILNITIFKNIYLEMRKHISLIKKTKPL